MAKLKPLISLILRIGIVAAILVWMVKTERLDFAHLNILFENIGLLLTAIGIWLASVLFLGTCRWYFLLKSLGIHVKLLGLLNLQLMGLFFNVTLPGSVSGDIIKGWYFSKHAKDKLVDVYTSLLLDRIIGLYTLILLSTLSFVLGLFVFELNEQVWEIFTYAFGVFLVFSTAFFVILVPEKDLAIVRWVLQLNMPAKLSQILSKVYQAIRTMHGQYRNFSIIIGISVLAQSLLVCFCIIVGPYVLTGEDLTIKTMVGFPIGLISTGIPLAPGGLGVGHLAFEELFQLMGLAGGANLFNIYTVSLLSINLVGGVAYLMRRKEIKETQ